MQLCALGAWWCKAREHPWHCSTCHCALRRPGFRLGGRRCYCMLPGGDWNDVWTESLTWKHWAMELVLWHLQHGMVSKSGFCWRTHWNIRNKTLEIRWTNPAAIKMNSSRVLCVAGYGACDVAYLLWDQIATNVVEERVFRGFNPVQCTADMGVSENVGYIPNDS